MLLLSVPLAIHAQYLGGNGKGDVSISFTGKYLSNWFNIAGNWSNTGNWSNGVLPASGENAIIKAAAVVDGDYSHPSLSITSTGSVTISAGKSLNISGTLTNSAGTSGLVIESNMTGTGNLVYSNSDVDATVKLFISQSKWHYFTVPFNSLAGVFHLPAGQADMYLIKFEQNNPAPGDNYPAYSWSYISNTGATLESGKGYGVWASTQSGGTGNSAPQPTISFSGTLYSGNVEISCSNSTSVQGDGYYFVGNPYPCTINRNSGDWYYPGLNAETHLFENNGNWHSWAGSGDFNIAPMQGFFVKFTDIDNSGPPYSETTLTIPSTAKSTGSSVFYKNDPVLNNHLKLMIHSGINCYSDNTIVRFSELATTGFDCELDAHKFFGLTEAPNIYSVCEEDQSINTLPFISGTQIVQLGYRVAVNGTYTITASEQKSFDPGSSVFLEDQLTSTFVDLMENESYSFVASTTDSHTRFRLHYGNMFTSLNHAYCNNVSVYSFDNTVYISSSEELKQLSVFDITGRLLISKIMNGTISKLSLNQSCGTYIIRIVTTSGNFSKIIFLN